MENLQVYIFWKVINEEVITNSVCYRSIYLKHFQFFGKDDLPTICLWAFFFLYKLDTYRLSTGENDDLIQVNGRLIT